MKNKYNDDAKAMMTSYMNLAYLTGRIEFFMASKFIERTNAPLLLSERVENYEQTLLV